MRFFSTKPRLDGYADMLVKWLIAFQTKTEINASYVDTESHRNLQRGTGIIVAFEALVTTSTTPLWNGSAKGRQERVAARTGFGK